MTRPIHFEIQATDMERARGFYARVFGWEYEDYSEYAGMPYFGIRTGGADRPGIDGGMMLRRGPEPEPGRCVNAFVVTMAVEDYDAVGAEIAEAGGTVALPKYALPGMAWQGYFHDTEGNIFGIHQPDEQAGLGG